MPLVLPHIFDAGISQQLLQEPNKRYHQRHEQTQRDADDWMSVYHFLVGWLLMD